MEAGGQTMAIGDVTPIHESLSGQNRAERTFAHQPIHVTRIDVEDPKVEWANFESSTRGYSDFQKVSVVACSSPSCGENCG